jgi:hypothetical protein
MVGALVGGSISLASTLFMQGRAQKLEAAKKEREGKKAAGQRAFFGLMKLVGTFESIENLARHFDKQLEEARGDGRGNLEPYDIYRATVGAPHEIFSLAPEEILFLAKDHGELIARIGEIQQRARNDEAIAREYSTSRRNLETIMLQHVSKSSAVDGPMLEMSIDQSLKVKVDVLQGQLNQMIVPLIIALEEDRKSSLEVIDDYIKIARSEFGEDFPGKRLELRGGPKVANS